MELGFCLVGEAVADADGEFLESEHGWVGMSLIAVSGWHVFPADDVRVWRYRDWGKQGRAAFSQSMPILALGWGSAFGMRQ